MLDKGENAYKFLSANVQVLTDSTEVTIDTEGSSEGGDTPGGGDNPGGGDTPGDGSENQEETLDPTEIQVFLQLQNSKISSITIATNRTVTSVNGLKLHV